MNPGEKLPFELNNFAPLTSEQRHILVTEIKKVSVPLMRVVELGKEAYHDRKAAATATPIKASFKPIKSLKSKIVTFFFTAFHYALFAYGVDFSLPVDKYFTGNPVKWYGHLYMWLVGTTRELWVEKNGDSFAAQIITLVALLALPFLVSLAILFIIRHAKARKAYKKQRRVAAEYAEKYKQNKKEIEEILPTVDANVLYFIPYRFRSGTCLTQIAMFLETNEAQTLQGAISLCEAYLRNRFGQWHMIHPDNCNLIDYSRNGKDITEYI